jgi:hypothetical protein
MTVGCLGLGSGIVTNGQVQIAGARVAAGDIQQQSGQLLVTGGLLDVEGPTTSNIQTLSMQGGEECGKKTVDVSVSFGWTGGEICGPGSLVLGPTTTGSIGGSVTLSQSILLNTGTLSWNSGSVGVGGGAFIENRGTMYANSEAGPMNLAAATNEASVSPPFVYNDGLFKKTVGTGTTAINILFDGASDVTPGSGTLQVPCDLINTKIQASQDSGGTTTPNPPPTALPPNFNDPNQSPGTGWTWRGDGDTPQTSQHGAWFNPTTKESWSPDLQHPPGKDPHWDYTNRNIRPGTFEWWPDGSFTVKNSSTGCE